MRAVRALGDVGDLQCFVDGLLAGPDPTARPEHGRRLLCELRADESGSDFMSRECAHDQRALGWLCFFGR